VLSGGRLGTNLVELGFIDLNTLGRYLARSMDLPLAIADRLEKADANLVETLGAELADRHSAIPLGTEKNDPQAIGVVMGNPTDRRSIAAIEEKFGCRIQPYVAAELRLFYYLERYYGIRRRTRFTRSAKSEDSVRSPTSRRERRSTQPFRGLTTPAAVSIAPRKEREAHENRPAETPPAPVLTLEEATVAIDAASDRNEIGEAVLRYTIGRFACSALFFVRDSNAIGWLAQAPGLGRASLERLNIPLGGTSVFQVAHDSGSPYRGPAVSPGHAYETQLWSLFAIDYEPRDVHIIPLRLGERIVNLLYAHSFLGHDASDEDAKGLALLAGRAEQAYRRIIAQTQVE